MTIVVGLDFSRPSRRALDWAISQAAKGPETLVLVHAFAGPKHPKRTVKEGGRMDPVSQVEAELDMDDAIRLSQDWAQSARDAGLLVETVAEAGDPADLVLRIATEQDAALVVVSTHGRSGIKRAIMGSVASAIVQRSDRPVVVVPAG